MAARWAALCPPDCRGRHSLPLHSSAATAPDWAALGRRWWRPACTPQPPGAGSSWPAAPARLCTAVGDDASPQGVILHRYWGTCVAGDAVPVSLSLNHSSRISGRPPCDCSQRTEAPAFCRLRGRSRLSARFHEAPKAFVRGRERTLRKRGAPGAPPCLSRAVGCRIRRRHRIETRIDKPTPLLQGAIDRLGCQALPRPTWTPDVHARLAPILHPPTHPTQPYRMLKARSYCAAALMALPPARDGATGGAGGEGRHNHQRRRRPDCQQAAGLGLQALRLRRRDGRGGYGASTPSPPAPSRLSRRAPAPSWRRSLSRGHGRGEGRGGRRHGRGQQAESRLHHGVPERRRVRARRCAHRHRRGRRRARRRRRRSDCQQAAGGGLQALRLRRRVGRSGVQRQQNRLLWLRQIHPGGHRHCPGGGVFHGDHWTR